MTRAVAATPLMISPPLGRRPDPAAAFAREGLFQVRNSLKQIRKTLQHASDSSDSSDTPWLSPDLWGQPVAMSTTKPILPSLFFTLLTTATHAAHSSLDTFNKDEDSLGSSFPGRHWQTNPFLAPTPIWEYDLEQCSLPQSGFLQSLRSYFQPPSCLLLFSGFPLQAFHWFCGLLMNTRSCTVDDLDDVRSDKYQAAGNHSGALSSDATCVETYTPSLRREKAGKPALGLDYSCQASNHLHQSAPSSSPYSYLVGQNRENPCPDGTCKSLGNAHGILQMGLVEGGDPTGTNCVCQFKRHEGGKDKPRTSSLQDEDLILTRGQFEASYSDPGDNTGAMKRENGNSRAPEDAETSRSTSKRQSQSSHYDDNRNGTSSGTANGTANGTTKAGKRRKQNLADRDDDDFDDFGGEGGGGGARGREEEESGRSKFACPFFKNNPQAFRASRTCVGPGWLSVHRVKEHIFRRHMLSDSRCHDCLEEFNTQSALKEHVRAPCQQRSSKSHGINKMQEDQLRSRRMYRKSLDEEEKWYAIYRIIFPNEENIPSPYYEPEVPEFPDCYKEFLIQNLPGIVTEQLMAPGSGLMEHINANTGTKPLNSYQEAITGGRKLNGESSLMGATLSERLTQQIKNAVEIAVRKSLSQVGGPKEPNWELDPPAVNVQGPDTESKGLKEEKEQLFQKPLMQDNLLQPPKADLKYTLGIPTPSPQSSTFTRSPTFKRSPDMPFRAMEQSQPTGPMLLQPAPPETDWLSSLSLLDQGSSDNIVQYTTGGNPFPELPTVPEVWANNNVTFGSEVYPSTGPDLNLTVPASFQPPALASQIEVPMSNFSLEFLNFPSAGPMEPLDSGYGSIIGPADGSVFDLHVDYLASESLLRDK